MQLQDKLLKRAEITYLQANKKTNKVRRNSSTGFEVGRKVGLMFWRSKDSIKVKSYVFSAYKQRNKVSLVDLNCKLQKYSSG